MEIGDVRPQEQQE
jgi:hypothetical protein